MCFVHTVLLLGKAMTPTSRSTKPRLLKNHGLSPVCQAAAQAVAGEAVGSAGKVPPGRSWLWRLGDVVEIPQSHRNLRLVFMIWVSSGKISE